MSNAPDPVRRSLTLGLPLLALPSVALADAALELAQAAHARPVGRNVTTTSRMELSEGTQTPRVRRLVTYRQDLGGGDSAYLARFLEPKDIAGVGLLSISRADGSTEQSLYLPELDRVRKVSGNRKGGRFVGSDLYFEDLQERKPKRDSHRLLGRETLAGVECDLLESTPLEADDSVYLRRLSWVERSSAMLLRVDYFERDPKTASKRWLVLERRRIQDYGTVTNSTMSDLTQGSSTRLVVESARYDRKLPARLFTPQALADESFESEYRL